MKITKEISEKVQYIKLLERKVDELKTLNNSLSKGIIDLRSSKKEVKIINSDCFKSIGVERGRYENVNSIINRLENKIYETKAMIDCLSDKINEDRKLLTDMVVSMYSEEGTRIGLLKKMDKITILNREIQQINRFKESCPYNMMIRVPDVLIPYLTSEIKVKQNKTGIYANSRILKELASNVLMELVSITQTLTRECDEYREILSLFEMLIERKYVDEDIDLINSLLYSSTEEYSIMFEINQNEGIQEVYKMFNY